MNKEVWVTVQSERAEYIELTLDNVIIQGYYYGYFVDPKNGVVFFKSPIVSAEKKINKLTFEINDYTYSYDPITPFNSLDSLCIFGIEEARVKGITSVPFLFTGEIRNNKLIIEKMMAFSASMFYRLEFEKSN